MILLAFILFGLAIYLFILFIIKRDRGHKEPTSALFAAAGFGLLAVLLAGFLNELFVPSQIMDSFASGESHGLSKETLLYTALSIGLIEETLKNVPLAFFIYKKRYFDELTDGVIYFGIAGLTFGIIEDIAYTLMYGGGVGTMRIITSPYLHSAFCILFGIILIRTKVFKRPWLLAAAGLLAATLAHGIYDLLVFSGGLINNLLVLLVAVSMNIIFFVLFRRSQREDEKRGHSSIGENKFCRHCGKPNPRRLLYCSFCGQLS